MRARGLRVRGAERERFTYAMGAAGEAVGHGGELVPDGVRLQLLLLRRRRRHLRSSLSLSLLLAVRWLAERLTAATASASERRLEEEECEARARLPLCSRVESRE
jgi:hypothetical protein